MEKKKGNLKIIFEYDGDSKRTIVSKFARKLYDKSDNLEEFFYKVAIKNCCGNMIKERPYIKEKVSRFSLRELVELEEIHIFPNEFNKTFYVSFECNLAYNAKDDKLEYWYNQEFNGNLSNFYSIGAEPTHFLDREKVTECWQDFLIEVLGEEYKEVLVQRLSQEIEYNKNSHNHQIKRIKTEISRYQKELDEKEFLLKREEERELKLKNRFKDYFTNHNIV